MSSRSSKPGRCRGGEGWQVALIMSRVLVRALTCAPHLAPPVSLVGLLAQGYESFTMEDFYETFLEQFTWVLESKPSSDELAARFQEDGLGQYIVSYARYLTSSYMAAHAADFAPFIQDGRSVEGYRRSEVRRLIDLAAAGCLLALPPCWSRRRSSSHLLPVDGVD
jgi:hypothetical protein